MTPSYPAGSPFSWVQIAVSRLVTSALEADWPDASARLTRISTRCFRFIRRLLVDDNLIPNRCLVYWTNATRRNVDRSGALNPHPPPTKSRACYRKGFYSRESGVPGHSIRKQLPSPPNCRNLV